ncbi:MAG TPA: M4 family metallopeptidase, partial [Kofleriaceae bacterium]|nr:M4 family metallopeptidase [Kofleriaceae bacterium]
MPFAVSRILLGLAILSLVGCSTKPAQPTQTDASPADASITATSLEGPVIPPGPEQKTPQGFIAWYVDRVGLDDAHTFVLEGESPSLVPGMAVVRYGHYYRGVRVAGDRVSLMIRDGQVLGAVDFVTQNIDRDVAAKTSEEDALWYAQRAINERHPESLKWDDRGQQCTLELSRATEGDELSVRHVCHLAVAGGPDYVASIDDSSGEVVRAGQLVRHQDAQYEIVPASVITAWYGVRYIDVNRNIDTNLHYLSGETIHALNASQTPPVDYTSTIAIFDSGEAQGAVPYWAAEETLEYLALIGLDPLSEIGSVTIFSNLPAPIGIDAAAAPPSEIYLSNAGINTSLDVVAHEIGHLTASGLGWEDITLSTTHPGDFDAVSESFSDILGEMVEVDVFGAADWITLGDYVSPVCNTTSAEWRNIYDPATSCPPQPEVLNHSNYANSTPKVNAHVNSSIASLFFARLALGFLGNGVVTPPMGHDKAFRIFSLMYENMVEGGDWLNAYTASTESMELLCGRGSQEWRAANDIWVTLNVIANTASPDLIVPADGGTLANPWDAVLRWQATWNPGAVAEEFDWEVQVSTDFNFPANPEITRTITTSDWDVMNGVKVGQVRVVLEASTQYYWRVRRVPFEPSLDCWRPTHTFTTGDVVPTPYAPTGTDTHPWNIPFSYSLVEGATHYEIQASEDSQNFSIPACGSKKLIIPAKPNEPDQTALITCKKNLNEVVWRVRALREPTEPGGETVVGGWSQPLVFSTNEPHAVQLSPAYGATVYPWPVHMAWQPVPGARFWIKSQAQNPFGFNGPNITEAKAIEEDEHTYYSPAQNLEAVKGHGWAWQLLLKGPPLGSKLDPDAAATAEPGVPSSFSMVYIDGAATMPQVTLAPSGCVDIGTELTASWSYVGGAAYYTYTPNTGSSQTTEEQHATFIANSNFSGYASISVTEWSGGEHALPGTVGHAKVLLRPQ